jgi:hypothetical protein
VKKLIAIVGLLVFVSLPSDAGSIKTWSTHETLRASDINANFSHIHNEMVGGEGARLVNADVSASAAIAHSKLATPALLPKAMAVMTTTCTAGTCALAASSGVTSIAFVSTGVYTVTIPARLNAVYGATVTPHLVTLQCYTDTYTTTTFAIRCTDFASGVKNGAFTVAVFDNDN